MCSEDITIGGVNFKKGMIVTIPIYAVHYDPNLWLDPETFNPDRSAHIKGFPFPVTYYVSCNI